MELLFIYMDGCPYCKLAGEVLENLFAKHPEYQKIPLVKVNENREPEKLKGRNYYYVPTFFYGEEKVYEAQPGDGREKMEKILGDFFKKEGVARKKYMCNIPVVESLKSEASG